MAKISNNKKPTPAPAVDTTKCPFTGEAIVVRELSNGVGFMATTSKWTSTIFTFRSDLEKFLATRDGVIPEKYRTPKIEIRDREPPALDPFADVKEKVGMLDDLTQEALR